MHTLLWYLNKAAYLIISMRHSLSAMCMCNATGSPRREIDAVVESNAPLTEGTYLSLRCIVRGIYEKMWSGRYHV